MRLQFFQLKPVATSREEATHEDDQKQQQQPASPSYIILPRKVHKVEY